MRKLSIMALLILVVGLAAGLWYQGSGQVVANDPDGPLGYWSFDAGDADDVSDHGNDGVVSGATDGAGNDAPIIGNPDSLDFDGVNDRLDMGDDPDFTPNGSALTVAAWIYPHNLGGLQNVVTKWNDNKREYQLQLSGTSMLFYANDDPGSFEDIKATSSALSNNTWYHVAGVWDGTDLRLYVNGVLDDGGGVAFGGTIDDSVARLSIGAQNFSGTWNRFFDGVIDEVQIYDRDLSAAEIAQLAGTSSTLVVNDEGTGTSGFGSTDCDSVGVPTAPTIQEAVDAAIAGDTIEVCPGTYTEDLSITTDDLELKGLSGSQPTIKGVAKDLAGIFPFASPNIDIKASDIWLHGFTIESPAVSTTHYSSGVVLTGTDIEIDDNDFVVSGGTPGSVAIQTWAGANALPGPEDISGLSIHDNTFTHLTPNAGFGYEGIFINPQTDAEDPANPVVITDNTFSGDMYRAIGTVRDYVTIGGTGNTLETDLPVSTVATFGGKVPLGIKVFGGDNVSVLDNVMDDSGFGVFNVGITIQGGAVTASDVTDNTVEDSAEHGIHLKAGADGWVVVGNTLGDNGASPGDGILVDGDDNTIGPLNTIVDNDGNGVHVTGNDNVVIGNLIAGNLAGGVRLTGDASDNTVVGNTINLNGVGSDGDGVYIGVAPDNNLIYGNTIEENEGDGVHVAAAGNKIIGNVIKENDTGVNVYSSNNLIINNFAKKNRENGYYIGGDNNLFITNEAIGNDDNGFEVSNGPTGNTFIENVAHQNDEFGFEDDSTGGGTAGTASTYLENICGGPHPNPKQAASKPNHLDNKTGGSSSDGGSSATGDLCTPQIP